MGVCQINQEIHLSVLIVYDENVSLIIFFLNNAFYNLECPPTDTVPHYMLWNTMWKCGFPKSIMPFRLLYTCVLHKHEIIHSALLTSKLGPEAISGVRKCIFTTHIHSKSMPSSAKKPMRHHKLSHPSLCYTLLHSGVCKHILQCKAY